MMQAMAGGHRGPAAPTLIGMNTDLQAAFAMRNMGPELSQNNRHESEVQP